MAESAEERTEQPTQRRRDEARQDGNVAKSQDLTGAFVMLAAIVMMYVFGMRLINGMQRSLEVMLTSGLAENPTRANDMGVTMTYTGQLMVASVAPLVLAISAVGLLVTLGQVGFLVTGKPLTPDLNRLNPFKGVKNLVDARAAMRLVMSLAKVAIIGGIASLAIYYDMGKIMSIAHLDVGPGLAASGAVIFSLAMKLAALLILLAIADYAYQRWQREKDLRMSKQDVKEEMKRMEGDPMIRQRRQRVARQLAMQRTSQAVPQADVVVTNPTHFAIALKYDSETMVAPKVVAKGADYLALRIRQIAAQHSIPIVERKEVARALYRSVEVGDEVPPDLYAAVAEILAYVYRLGDAAGTKTAAAAG